jgi:eukaryotic-like serine/threonine-protein kinase
MAINSGTKLGPYEIQSPLGSGGMGEVYRARDTRLGRDVAVKVLPQHLSSNSDLKARFEREARAISALSHPHICHLYDIGSQDGTDYLVMELLEGESLADRLQRGALPLKKALDFGIQIAEALEKAHEQGIVHRDLKPGNVVLTKSGAKLLDFGLAKPNLALVAAAASPSSDKLTPSTPTLSIAALSAPVAPLTQQGQVLGTLQYMAPEVLRGQEADARSDIFSLGCVLYEMVSGKHAFEGKSQLSVVTAILEKDPESMPSIPAPLEHVVATSLAKEPADRWQTSRDLARELRWVAQSSSAVAKPEVARIRWRSRAWMPWTSAVLASACALFFAALYLQVANRPVRVVRAQIAPPQNATFAFNSDVAGPVVMAPDGNALAFVADSVDGKHMLWVRELSADTARALPGTEGATFPFWSPGGRTLGFFADGKLRTIDIDGGAPTAICDAAQGRGGAWNKDGIIIFSPAFQGALYKVAATGGMPVQVTKIDSTKHDSHRWPIFLPDGRHFLYLAVTHRRVTDPADAIYLGSLDGSESRMVMSSLANVIFSKGYVLFLRGNQLMAQEFDAARGVLRGSASKIADDTQNDPTTWHGTFDASSNGVLVYGTGGGAEAQLTWFDRDGKVLGTVGSSEVGLSELRLSPEGGRVGTTAAGDIWVHDLTRNVRTRLTFNGQNQSPVWSPDGNWIAFFDFTTLTRKRADGAGEAEKLFDNPHNTTATDWSPDGKFLLYNEGLSGTGQKVWALPMEGEPKPILLTPAKEGVDQSDAAFSPDGRWISYSSTESGRNEVYVAPFQHGAGRWQVSTSGGDWSRWSHDGKELIYMALDRSLIAVPVTLGLERVTLGTPHVLFRTTVMANNLSTFDFSHDGKRVLIASTTSQSQSAPLTVVLNWAAELRK